MFLFFFINKMNSKKDFLIKDGLKLKFDFYDLILSYLKLKLILHELIFYLILSIIVK